MLTILRKIRQSLIESGSARKYLIYAIGEIALVVLGILIALQINNWNQELANQKIQSKYLSNLLNELVIEIEQLNNYKSDAESKIDAASYVISCINHKTNPNNEEVVKSLKNSISIHRISNMNSIYQDLISSGNIKLIGNDSLRTKILKYYAQADIFYKHTWREQDFNWKETLPYFVNKAYLPWRNDYDGFMNNLNLNLTPYESLPVLNLEDNSSEFLKVENNLLMRIVMLSSSLIYLDRLLKNAEQLKINMTKELVQGQ